jgi:Alpha/beta hydrolase domain
MRVHRRFVRWFGGLAALMIAAPLLGLSTSPAGAAPPGGRPVGHPVEPTGDKSSQVTSVQVSGTQPFGPFTTGMWERIWGTISGVIGPGDGVVGFSSLPTDSHGLYHYTSQFEVIIPDSPGVSSNMIVDIENRGNPTTVVELNELGLLSGSPATVSYPPQLGTGFMQDHGLSYGRVQWQTGIVPDVPATVQGLGLVIIRDFGRLFAGPRFAGLRASAHLPSFEHTILFGGSQSAWFANTFLAEGYNRDPQTGGRVFDGVFELDGAGNWLAINRLAEQAGVPQVPYVSPNGVPLSYGQLLPDPASTPRQLVDVVKLTDYYRLRASVSLQGPIPPTVHRYDMEAAHAAAFSVPPALLFNPPPSGLGCNSGHQIQLNPIDTRKYEDTLMLDLVAGLGSPGRGRQSDRRLPRSAIFLQAPAPPGSNFFNDLPGHQLTVPAENRNGIPVGGVAMPDEILPLGQPSPPALPHVGTLSITDGCGNFGGWVSYTTSQLASRYGSLSNYERAARVVLNILAAHHLVLRSDIGSIVNELAAQFQAAPQ